ncbi:MAG: ribonuclease P protein component [Candidatus Kerfeldbacteria bacterium CG08_land_8_20_14_0_20_40_16]|uniref:Ribonuclease P protein component n=1 Tax=Candidatus Kerfeldbacteria bacterium CG08_land_8_20_14_0_20_40_16 TaxID=2014244 RepID=A0A2H0YWE0_9BACT|nr:MAG: ribonuclease P protein component [Candidatus Kerfeldbacteria bacterium CG08_land_8_20_14_0_20_40_16]
MLAKQYRLVKNKEFAEVYRKGRSAALPTLVLRLKKQGQEIKGRAVNSRFGFVVSGKIFKKIVLRNKLKRQLRSIIQGRLNRIPAGFDCVIIARSRINTRNYRQIEEDVDQLLQKSNLLKPNK